jgi:adenylate kinase
LEDLRSYAAKNNGSYPEEQVLQFIKTKLSEKRTQNQGYVLDGFPAVMKDAQALFSDEESPEESNNNDVQSARSSLPEFILSLDCSNEFIKKRIMALPEEQLVNTKNSEEALTARLDKFRTENTDEVTVLNFFDEQEIHPIVLKVESITPAKLVDFAIAKIGQPRNYGPTLEELREKKRLEEDQKARDMIVAEQERIKREKEEDARHQKEVAEWVCSCVFFRSAIYSCNKTN